MEKTLNIEAVKSAASAKGLSQTAIARDLGLTKAAVSKWFNGLSMPRPADLLKFGKLLGLRYGELVIKHSQATEPLVAFRKRGSCITTDKHIAKAKDMGQFLKPLVKYLDFDKFVGPATLKQPSTEYRYLQELVARLRREMDVSESGPIDFKDIVDCFHKYQAVIIPALWGKKDKHENALHIHLPDSKTTWIYLNLDSKVHDFKYWMAHEFGHVLTVDLLAAGKVEEAENFADAFAGALLFPQPAAKESLARYKKARNESGRIKILVEFAEVYLISPFSVYLETQKYAKAQEESFTTVDERNLHTRIAIWHKSYKTLSAALFDDEQPNADHFMRVAQEQFDTDFYKVLGEYLREHEATAIAISGILGVSPVDARAFHEALVTA